ncbi:hypothetical protein LCGC14_0852940 [marine sediment metagenome]|uniref:Uncharacterized protein n=1 Tax=marine sediment metagenome TaxID=412755 RepID=A0A0F9PEI8_9ZZZZ
MAVAMMSTIQRWEGLSVAGGDAKPAAPGFVGSTYYETDTGRTYLWNGAAWVIMPVHILNVQGGVYTIQELMEQFQSMPDLARSPQSGDTLMDGNELVLYEQADIHPFIFGGGYTDWTGLNAGAGEDTTIRAYAIIESGGVYRLLYNEVFLAAAVPIPILTPHPRDINTQVVPRIMHNVYGIKITAQQALVGGGWNTLACEWFDALRGG